MKTNKRIGITLLVALLPIFEVATNAADVNARYPYRLPDWFWQAPEQSHLISTAEFITLKGDAQKLKALQQLEDSSAADSLEEDIAKRLSAKFAARDLAFGAYVATDAKTGTSLAVQFDPMLDEKTKDTLKKATSLFLSVALDAEVIKQALARSTATPSPMPPMYEMKDGKPVMDEVGRPVFTKDYNFYLTQRALPSSIDAFTKQLRDALSAPGGDSTALFISQYSGNVWWGGSWYGYFNSPIHQAGREKPSRGYLYIRLNTDKLTEPQPHWDDPVFWASKIAHEVLHNFSYWHPAYKDPAERDASNHDNEWAFIVSYEVALYEKLKSL